MSDKWSQLDPATGNVHSVGWSESHQIAAQGGRGGPWRLAEPLYAVTCGQDVNASDRAGIRWVSEYPPLRCDRCGSPDVREIEDAAGRYVGRRCVDCGWAEGPG